MRADDLERTVIFYEHALGLAVVRRFTSPSSSARATRSATGHADGRRSLIAFIDAPEGYEVELIQREA